MPVITARTRLHLFSGLNRIIELDFEGDKPVGKYEHCYVEKEWEL